MPGIRISGSLLITHLALLDPSPGRLRSVAEASEPESIVDFEAIAGAGIRSVSHHTDATEHAKLRRLRTDYFIAVPEMTGAYLLSFSIPAAPSWEPAAMELTDSIARGFHLAEQQDLAAQRRRRG